MLKKPRAREYFSIKYCFAGEEEKIPHVLDSYVKNQLDLSDVNRVLELSNIKQFFDKYDHVNGCFGMNSGNIFTYTKCMRKSLWSILKKLQKGFICHRTSSWKIKI